jgi:23S rRNA pseudouridine1911/1915/1917 synthase
MAQPSRDLPPLPPERVRLIDRDVVLVDKPSGLISVPFDAHEVDTLLARLQAYLRRTRVTGPSWRALKPVHRIDKGTSGLLLVARHEVAYRELKRTFRAHDIQRVYLALAHGQVPAGRHQSHLAPNRGDGLRGSVRDPKRGKLAITHVTPLLALDGATLVACELETGRTNQIRVHLAEAGHPLLGETQFMRDFGGAQIPAPRLALHAAVLGFPHPRTRRPMFFDAPLPDDLAGLTRSLGGDADALDLAPLLSRWERPFKDARAAASGADPRRSGRGAGRGRGRGTPRSSRSPR